MSDKEKSMEIESDNKTLTNSGEVSGEASKEKEAKSEGLAEETETKKSKTKHKKHKKDKHKDKEREEVEDGRQSAYYLKPLNRERTSSAFVRKKQTELEEAYNALTPRQKEILERMERGETITPPPSTPSEPELVRHFYNTLSILVS